MLHPHLIAETRPRANPDALVFWRGVRVTVLGDRLFRLEYDPSEQFCDNATQRVWFRDFPTVRFTRSEEKDCLRIVTDRVTLVIKIPIEDSIVLVDGRKLSIRSSGSLPGTARTLDEYDGDTHYESGEKLQLGGSVISRDGLAVLDDLPSLRLMPDGTLAARTQAQEADYYLFAYGSDYRGAIRALYRLCGAVPVIPRYALGNWWSRYHAYTDEEYCNLLDRFRAEDIPLTVATVDMDWHWSNTLNAKKHITADGKCDEYHGFFPESYLGWTGYSWNTDLFPDHARFLRSLKERGLHVTLNLHPAQGVRYYEDAYPAMAKAMGVDPASERVIPFDFTDTRFINAYFDILHHPYEDEGVDFWWIDWQQGTESALAGLDPLWSLNHYHTLDAARNGKAPLILSRFAGIGSHRYPLGFSGDTIVSWHTLAHLPYFTATASNAGYTWWSHDIGGHMHGVKDNELYTRMVQFGVFSPINRLHGSNQDVMTKEPWVYTGGSGKIAADFLRLRHRMIPFLYSAGWDTHRNGDALVEPMYYEWPGMSAAYPCHGQYLFARQLIVAPVVTPADGRGLSATPVWLPPGHYTDFFTGDEYEGGDRRVMMYRWLDSIPVLMPAGSFFPLDGRRHTNRTDNPDLLTVAVTNGEGTYTLHEDSPAGQADTVFASSCGVPGEQNVTVTVQGDAGVIPPRTLTLEMRNIMSGSVRVLKNGEEQTPVVHRDAYLSVTLTPVAVGDRWEVTVADTTDPREKRNRHLLDTLQRLEAKSDDLQLLYNRLKKQTHSEARREIARSFLSKREKSRMTEGW